MADGQNSFIQRQIEITVQLAQNPQTNQPGTFDESGTNTVTISGARASVRIQNSGAPAGSKAQVDVYGLTPSLMNQLATLGLVWNIVPKNTITITAGDAVNGLTPVFSGTIFAGYGNYNAAPNVDFHFEAMSTLIDAVAPAPASSFTGPTDVATIMAGFARQLGLGFENNGVSVQLSNPYFPGSLRTQMLKCAEHAGIRAEVINGNLLAIWPIGGSRNTTDIPLVAPETGMIGFPDYTQQGIIVRTVFNPKIAFGGLIHVKSSLKPVAEVGTWAVNTMDLALDSKVPHGQWMHTINAWNPKYPRPIPQ